MRTFQAIRVHKTGSSTHSRIEKITLDDLSTGEVVIQVAYSSINYKDALAITGKGRIMRKFPCVAGIDLAGVVVDSSTSEYDIGDKVIVTGCNIGELLDGGLSEFARVPASAVVPLPQGLSLFEAMALGTAGFTAAMALQRMLDNHQSPMQGPIAVTGPTGGVGSIALALLKKAGFSATAITGKPEAADYLVKLGADQVIDRRTLDTGSKPLETAIWGGAIDNLGGETLAYLTRTVKPWGNIASIGLAQDASFTTTVMPLILRGVSLLGIHSVECPRSLRLSLWEKLASDWKLEQLDSLLAPRVVSLNEVSQVCEELIAGRAIGRTVVRISD